MSVGSFRVPGNVGGGPCDDVTIQLVDTAAANIGSPDVYAPGTNTTKTAPDGSVTIRNSVPTTLHTVAVKSNGAATQDIADSTITRPDGTTVGLAATVALDVRGYRSGILYMGGINNWSGQSTVYRAGDEGTAYANGLYTFTDPFYPTHASRLSDFYTLAANNIHGNTLRFTDRAGAAPATSGNRFIQDHSTGWEYYRLGTLSSALWNAQVDAGVALNATLGETGWVLCPIDLLELIADRSLGTGCLNYGGFLMGTSGGVWSSTTRGSLTTNAFSFFIDFQRPANELKASVSNNALFCRRFAA